MTINPVPASLLFCLSHSPGAVVQVGLVTLEDHPQAGEEDREELHGRNELQAEQRTHLQSLCKVAAQKCANACCPQHIPGWKKPQQILNVYSDSVVFRKNYRIKEMTGKRIIKDVVNGCFLVLSMTFKDKERKKEEKEEKKKKFTTNDVKVKVKL